MLWNAVSGQVTIGSTAMNYASFGHGEKILVVLPGLSDGLTTVKGKALLLAAPYKRYFERYTIYIFSRKNEMPPGYSIPDMADDQAKALKTLGLKKISILGVSQGGMIAQSLAINHADLVEKLIIAVSAPRVNAAIQECIGHWVDYANQGNHKRLMIDTAEKSYSEKYLKKYRKLYPLLGKLGKPANYSRFLINANAILCFDALNDLKKIICPTLIVGGSDDKIVGIDASYALKNRILNSELYVYDGLGHAAYEEADDFYERVFRFLDMAQ